MEYNVTIIGAGSAGIEAAKVCARNKLKTVLIEEKKTGGICLNQGCIPTKFFLNHSLPGKEYSLLYKEKEDLLSKIRSNLVSYLKSQQVDIIYSRARIKDKNTIETEKKTITTDYIIIATGSSPVVLPGSDSRNILTPEEFLDSDKIHNKYLIVGAGAIGVEFSFLLAQLGKQVSLIEKEDSILPFLDKEMSKRIERILKKKKVDINKSQDVKDYNLAEFDKVIFALGRKPNLAGLGLENAGVSFDNKARVITDDYLRTSVPNIYICGDAACRYFYAYTAEYEGRICAENIMSKGTIPDYRGIPQSIFTKPSLSSCGQRQEDIEAEGIEHNVAKYTFKAISSSYVYDDTQGFAKVISDKKGYILGAHIISNISHEIIGYFSLCMRNNLKKEVLERLILVHPTISEFVTKI